MDKVWNILKDNVKVIISIVTIVSMIVGGAFAYNHFYPKGLIASLIERETNIMKQQYEQDLAAKDKEIDIIQERLKKSQTQISKLNNKIKTLEGKLQNVQIPVTAQETRDRFKSLGYTPSR